MSRIYQHKELLSNYDSIVFDLDGTLYNSEQFYLGSFEDMAQWLTHKGLHKNEKVWIDCVMGLKAARGNDYNKLIDDSLSLLAIDLKFKKELLQIYKDHDCRYLILHHNESEVLEYLKSCNKTMFIITNGTKSVQKRKVTKLGLDPYMEEIVILDAKKNKDQLKPDNEAFYMLSEKYNLGETIMVGDRFDVDGVFAQNSGIDFLGVGFHGD